MSASPASGNSDPSEPDVAPMPSDSDSPARGGRRRVAPVRLASVLVAILAGSGLFMGGFTLGAHVATTPGTPADQEARFGAFWDVYGLINSEYAGSPKPSQDALAQAAIKGMMESLNDPWSYYQGPEDFANSLLNVGGQGEGIGVEMQLQPIDPTSSLSCNVIGAGCQLAVLQAFTGSPAAAAGIQAGDVIQTADGTALLGMTVDQAITHIKGPKGTPVTLGLLRGGKSLTITIVRDVYTQPEVVTRTLGDGTVGYIQVTGMNDPAASQLDTALGNALAAGQKNVILDLRGNLGGYVSDAVKMASEFIGSGPIVYQVDAAGKETELSATSGGRATDASIHLVVLVDGNTASAAEILSGALQARGRAKLIGSKTYGKGVVQEWLPLPDNFGGIHLTVARWLTPNHVWIQGKGLIPDVPIDSSNARAGTDPVLDAALAQFGLPPEPTASASPDVTSPVPSSSGAPAAPTSSPS